MEIKSISASFPERKVSNEETINILRENSQKIFTGDLELMLDRVKKTLEYTGLKTRRWLSKNEKPFDHIEKVINEALSKANMKKEDIEMLIFAGLDKRVIEPGFSFFIAKAMGFKEIECFDVTEACNTWTRAVIIADSFLKTKRNQNVMVVTSEFFLHENEAGFKNFSITKEKDLEWAFPTYTLGESATAVILTENENKNWDVKNTSYPEYADLCLTPFDSYDDIMGTMNGVSFQGQGDYRFISYGKLLHQVGAKTGIKFLEKHNFFSKEENYDIVFPHTQAVNPWEEDIRLSSKKLPFFYIFQDYGNLITGSVPGAIYIALKEGKLKRGDKVLCLLPTAGMSFSLYSFIY